ncbi:MAG: lamin tail domain-containing protein [Patescibacteria group bacterium]
MKKCIVVGQILWLFLWLTNYSIVVPFQARAEELPTVVINELMWMGSSLSASDEWLELRNLSDQPIDLSGWRLTKLSNGQDVTMLTIPSGKTIAPSGFFLISNYSAESAQSTLNIQPDIVDTAVALANTSLRIKLYSGTGELIDTADDGTGQPLAGDYSSGTVWKSMERNDLYEDGALPTAWHTATESVNFDVGALTDGTPLLKNSVPNQPPVAVAGPDQTVAVNETVNFDGSASSDPDGDELHFRWDFDNGDADTEITTTSVYTEPGDYVVSLTVADDELEDTDTLTITVEDPAPTPDDDVDETIEYSDDIRINELLPNPEGGDLETEFIELKNTGAADVDLSGWKIADTSRSYTIHTEDLPTAIINAGGFFVLPRNISRLALNNASPETVRLSQPDNAILDEVTYDPPVAEGQSYNFTENGWLWSTTITQGGENIITAPKKASTDDDQEPDHDQPPAEPEKPTEDFSTRVALTELLPNPDGEEAEEEFIEIGNFDTREIDLIGWQLTDKKTYYQIDKSTVIEPGEYIALYRSETHIALNNPGDEVFLIGPGDKIISGVSYQKAGTGQSWSRRDQTTDWLWSSATTPNEPNEFIDAENTENDPPVSAATSEKTSLEAIVTAPNDIFGIRTAYLQAGEDGLLLTLAKGDLPILSAGDRVSVTGNLRVSGNNKKLTISSPEDIIIVGPGDPPTPQRITGSELDDRYLGRLISIEGTVASKSGQNLLVNSGNGDVSVYLKRPAKLSLTGLNNSDAVIIIGIVVADETDGYRILPRFQTDIAVLSTANSADQPSDVQAQETALTGAPNQSMDRWPLIAVIALIAAGLGVAIFRKHRGSKKIAPQ